MAQTVNVRVQATVTVPSIGDVATVNLAGADESMVVITNNGTGVVWLSFDPTVTASSGGAGCFSLKNGLTLTVPNIERGVNSTFTATADTASTVFSLICLPRT